MEKNSLYEQQEEKEEEELTEDEVEDSKMSEEEMEEETQQDVMEEEEIQGEDEKREPLSSENFLKPNFPALKPTEMNSGKSEFRKVYVPPHRLTPLKENWLKIVQPIVEHMKLQIRMNLHTKNVELKTSQFTQDIGSLQKAADFIQAFILGFDIEDAVALLRMDDLYIETFTVEDVKPLHGEHLSRAIGRIAGKDGKTKFTIENVTRTRIVLADKKIHILGTFNNIKIARDAVCDLILGSPPGKVYAKLRTIAGRMKERF